MVVFQWKLTSSTAEAAGVVVPIPTFCAVAILTNIRAARAVKIDFIFCDLVNLYFANIKFLIIV